MGLIVDIVIIAILALSIIMGYKKGLINVIFNIFAFLLAIIITLVLYKPVSNIIIKNTDIQEKIETAIIENTKGEENKKEEKTENRIQKYIENTMQNAEEDAKSKAIEVVAKDVSTKCIEIITALILFVITRIILIVLKFLTETLANLPVVKQCNEIGGLLYGVIKGILIIYVILTIMFFVISLKPEGMTENLIETSYITKFLYNNNIIVNYCLLGKNLL
jgi:uncharacterized membrane protein required for colicin V production